MKDSDLGDVLDRGEATVEEVVAAALASDPVSVDEKVATGKASEAGRECLDALYGEVRAAQDEAAQKAAIRGLMGDDARLAAVAYFYSTTPNAVAVVLDKLGDFRGLAKTVSRLDSSIRWKAKAISDAKSGRTDPSRKGRDLAALLGDPTLPKGLYSPPGWRVDDRGVWVLKTGKGDDEWIQVAPSAILLRSTATDVNDGSVVVEVGWSRGGRWNSRLVGADEAGDSRKIHRLRKWGAPVTSVSARDCVRFLEAFEAANAEALPDTPASRRCGWIGNGGSRGFLLGERHVPDGDVVLAPADNCEALAGAVGQSGTWEGWIGALDLLSERPLCYLSVYIAAASLLLEPLDAPGFVADWNGETTGGKTLSLAVGASVYGSPDTSGRGIVRSWSDTPVFIQEAAAFYHTLPLILDESQKAGRYKGEAEIKIAEVVYTHANGIAKGKGDVVGIRAPKGWRSVLLSSGEESLTSFASAGGVAARVLSITGSPLGEKSEANRQLATNVEAAISEHYGHLAPRLVEWLYERREKWGDLRRLYAREVDEIAGQTEGVGYRIAKYLAVVSLTARILHDRIGVPRPKVDPIPVLRDLVLDGLTSADRPLEALAEVVGWASANSSKFWGRHTSDKVNGVDVPREPALGWYGRWDDGQWIELAVRTKHVRRVLSDAGIRFGAVVEAWKDRGWIVHTSGRNDRSTRFGSGAAKCVVFARFAVEQILNDDDDGEEW